MPVTPPTTFRTDVAQAILSVLNSFVAAHPTLLLRAYLARPVNVTVDLPAAFVDARPERVVHDSGTRTRVMSPSVVVVREYTENLEAMAAFDALVDLLMDAFTEATTVTGPGFGSHTNWRGTGSVADEEYQIGDYLYPAVRFTFDDISIQEGRG